MVTTLVLLVANARATIMDPIVKKIVILKIRAMIMESVIHRQEIANALEIMMAHLAPNANLVSMA